MQTIFRQLSAALASPSPAFASAFSEHLSKGSLGHQLANLQSLFALGDSLISSSHEAARLITTVVIPTLSDLISEQQKAGNQVKVPFEAARVAEQAVLSNARASAARLSALQAALEQQNTAAPPAAVVEFAAAVRAHRALIADLNAKHREFVAAAKATTDRLASTLVGRQSHLRSLLLNFHPILAEVIDAIAAARDSIRESGASTFGADFRAFALKHGIVRTSVVNEDFQPYAFSFEEANLPPPPPTACASDRVIPIAIAVVTAAFAGADASELSVEEGERLYLFESLEGGGWVFVASADEKRRGFVPAAVLRVIEGRTVFAAAAQLALEEGQPSFGSGELLVVTAEEGPLLVCQGIDGSVKRIPAAITV